MRTLTRTALTAMTDQQLITHGEILGVLLGEIEKHPYDHGHDDDRIKRAADNARTEARARGIDQFDFDEESVGKFDDAFWTGHHRGRDQRNCGPSTDAACSICRFWNR